jgi:transposase-like protein
MVCLKCKSAKYCKDGIVKSCQRYKCKACNYRYTVERKSDVKPEATKRLFALELYLEGIGFRAIGTFVKSELWECISVDKKIG